ncbi:MAG TPA: CPBP family intramembrane glutamic endopeptidase [Candidatus Binataceae bacterium]|nr:CPBP family intramembrane glutamic endopeptidase [Candidatus Binataceae bacterium]
MEIREQRPASDSTVASPRRQASITRRERLSLLFLVALSVASTIPIYRISITDYAQRVGWFAHLEPRQQAYVYALFVLLVASLIYLSGLVGLWASKRAHLTPMPIIDTDGGSVANRLRALRPAVRFGFLCVAISFLIVVPQLILFGSGPSAGASPALLSRRHHFVNLMTQLVTWRSVGVILLGAPIREEIVFRLLLVSALGWLLGEFWKHDGTVASTRIMWTTVVVSGLAFGLLHVMAGESVAWWRPIYAQVFLDPRTYIGMVLAWLYWKRGIEAAIVAHATLNAIGPIIVGLAIVVVRGY